MVIEPSMIIYNFLNILVTSVGFAIVVNKNGFTLKKLLYFLASVFATSFVTTLFYDIFLRFELNTPLFLAVYYITLCLHVFIITSIFIENRLERLVTFSMIYELAIFINILSYLLYGDIYIPIYFHTIKVILWTIVVIFFRARIWQTTNKCIHILLMNKSEYNMTLIFSGIFLTYEVIFYIETIITIFKKETNVLVYLKFALLLVITIGVKCLMLHLSERKTENINLEREKFLIEQKELRLHELDNIEMEIKVMRHDQKHIFHTMRCLLGENNMQAVMDLISSKSLFQAPIRSINYCENDVANAILTSYFTDNNQINADIMIEMPKECFISSYDIAILLGNIVENAINSCKNSIFPEIPFIELRGSIIRSNFVLVCKNSCAEEVQFKNGQPVNKNHASYGTLSIAYLVEKYNGNIVYSINDGVFTVSLTLQNNI